METNFRRKSAEIGDTPYFLGLAFHNEWQCGKANRRVSSTEVLSTSYKNLVNFGPLTDGLATIYAPNARNRRNAFDSWDSHSTTDGAELLNGFAPNSQGRRVWSFARTSLNVRVKGQRSKSPGTKYALRTPNTPAVSTKWNALVADNVAQAANATSRSLVRGVFASLRSACG